MRAATLLFGLLILGASLWAAWWDGPAPGEPEGEHALPAGTPASDPMLEGQADANTRPAAVPSAWPVAAEAAPGGAPVDPVGRYRVHGSVSGVPADEAGRVRVTVQPLARGDFVVWDGARGVTAPVGDDLRFDLDVSALFEHADPGQLEVRIDHPRTVPAKQRIDVSEHATKRTWSVHLTLVTAAVAIGLVTDEQGRPLEHAAVAAYAMAGGEPVVGNIMPVPPRHEVRTDGQGHYRLRLAGSGTHAVVALHGTHLAASTIVETKRSAECVVEPLVLRSGATLSGTARLGAEPIPAVSVSAHRRLHGVPSGAFFSLDDRLVRWREGGMHLDEAYADTDAEGRFALLGLEPGDWHVQVWNGEISDYDVIMPAVLRATRRSVTVPATGVELVLGGGTLVIDLLGLTEPTAMALIMVSTAGSSASANLERRRTGRLLLAPDVEVELRVGATGSETATRKIRGPAQGTTHRVEVTLLPQAPRPTLIVTLEDAQGRPVERASFRVRAKDPGAGADPEATATEYFGTSPEGVYTLDDVPPGRVTVRVYPWSELLDTEGYGLPIKHETTLPGEGEVELALTARRGGRLRMAARNAEGKLLEAACTVRDADGVAQSINFSSQRGTVMMSMPGRLSTLSAALTDPPLPPGPYTVEVIHGTLRKTVSVKVVRGQTTVVDIMLAE